MITRAVQELKKEIKNNIFIYDIEVFKKWWCITFYDVKNNQSYTINNSYFQLSEFVKYKLKNALVGGFNNLRYDDWIIRELLLKRNPWELSQAIVVDNIKPWEYRDLNSISLPFFSFDVMSLPGTGRIPLKKYEAFLGIDIRETTVPFDIDRELTKQEQDEVIKYNKHDVKATTLLFLKYYENFLIKCKLLNAYNLNPFNLKKTTAQLTASIFGARKDLLPFYSSYKYTTPDNIKQLYRELIPEYYYLIDKFENETFYTEFYNAEKKEFEINLKINNLIYVFALGGLHSAIPSYISETQENILTLDIFSNYPNLIHLYNYGSRRAPKMEQMIKEILQQRAQAKKDKDTNKAAYLKELLVTPFGAMEYKYNDLWDAKQRMSICITGQLLIFLYAMLLSKVSKVLQVNTDGVYVKYETEQELEQIKEITKFWEIKTGLIIEWDNYKYLWQKDVNNYIIAKDKNDPKTWKTKGSMVKYWNKQFHNLDFNDSRGTKNNNLTAIDEAVVYYFLQNRPVIDTLKSIKDLVRFQFIFEKKGKYSSVYLGDKEQEDLKVFRIFYVKNGAPVFKCYKDNSGVLHKEKIANSSENCLIYNDIVLNKTTEFLDLDYEYYEKLANERIRLFLNNTVKEKIKMIYPGESLECSICSESLENELVVRKFQDLEVCKNCYFSKRE
ncbi:DNA polymerase [Mycoplasmopsis phage vB_Mfe_PMF329]|nr:DNA polymerase [Mycoplasmopsis phage vB_Mfe_PMF329]